MDNKEAIRRILDHKRVHSLNEPRAVLINEALDLAIKALENERQQGEWIEVDIKPTPYGGYTCNRKCKRCNYFTKEYRLNYCPNCGADMRGEKE